MSTIPASNWVLDKVYFEVKLVDDFSSLYKEWFIKENGGIEAGVGLFISNLQVNPTISIYRFPNELKTSTAPHDFFEQDDDNFVIPRELFKLI